MTRQKHLKQLVRARMAATGERYAAARRHVIRAAPNADSASPSPPHLPGNVPATSALRALLTAAGIRAPHTDEPFTEAMLFGIAGGIGIGVFSFVYEKANFASFYVAGRHDWANDVRYLTRAAERLGAQALIAEGVKPAAQSISGTLAAGQPCIVWLDAAGLPYKAMPSMLSGMASHVVVLYAIDADARTASVGDLSDQSIVLPVDVLSAARARIKKDKSRVMTLRAPAKLPALDALVRGGLEACRDGLLGADAVGSSKTNFSLEVLRVWATRLHGSRDKDSWERVFTPGARLWRGLTSINEYIEHHGTGGGLARPLFAEFLDEAASALGSTRLGTLAERYAEIGRGWSELADAALPDDVAPMKEAKDLLTRRSELMHCGDPAATEEVRATWRRLEELTDAAQAHFPLSDSAVADLRADLQRRVLALYAAEVAAHETLSAAIPT